MKNFTAVILAIALAAPGVASAHGIMGRPGMLPEGVYGPPPATECYWSHFQGRLICEQTSPSPFTSGSGGKPSFDLFNINRF